MGARLLIILKTLCSNHVIDVVILSVLEFAQVTMLSCEGIDAILRSS